MLRDEVYIEQRTNVTVSGDLNFTNPEPDGPRSGACAINGLLYNPEEPMTETIGALTELTLHEVSVHPFHHHIQP